MIEDDRPIEITRHAVTPVLVRERSLLSPTPTVPDQLVKKFEIVEGASIRAKNQLLDGLGNRYGLKKSVPNKDGVFTWLCTRRGRKNEASCAAYVKQIGEVFTEGPTGHCHEPNPELNLKVPLVKQMKDVALKNLFESANALAEDLLVPVVKENPSAIIPAIENLARAANRKREHERPLHPTDLFFELNPEHLPKDFYRGEVLAGGNRHLLFATDEQIKDLQSTKRWYVDGTFDIAQLPFSQLYSFHGFVTKDGKSKQIPLFYIMMSGKELNDYDAVLRKIKTFFDPNVPIALEEVVLDFETAVKSAFLHNFEGIKIFGCSFHWVQSVYRHPKKLGFSPAYKSDPKIQEILREVLSLPMVPWQQIENCFNDLRQRSEELRAGILKLNEKRAEDKKTPLSVVDSTPFFDYVEKTWIKNRTWPPKTWSVYFQIVRTNNDVEGWHRRLNSKAPRKGDLNFYNLVGLLMKEAEKNLLNKQLILQGKTLRAENKKYKRTNERIRKIWEKYRNEEYTVLEMLKYCSKTYKMPNEYELVN